MATFLLHLFVVASFAVVYGKQNFNTSTHGSLVASYAHIQYLYGVNMSTPSVKAPVTTPANHIKIEPCQETSDFIFVVDASASVGEQNFRTSLNFTANLILALLENPNSRAGIVTFAEKGRSILYLSHGADITTDDLQELVTEAEYYNTSTTNGYWGLWRAIIQFDINNRTANQVILYITNGPSDNQQRLEEKAKDAQEAGIQSFALGIGPFVSDTDLSIVSANIRDRIFKLETYEALANYSGQISRELCIE